VPVRVNGGTKIVLAVKDEAELCNLFYKARMAKLPCAMITEHMPDAPSAGSSRR
jgi:peptidyl-tRNA hydrolase